MTPSWLQINPRRHTAAAYGPAQRAVVSAAGLAEVEAALAGCPAHRSTPLHDLPAMARRLGLEALTVKDESLRFGFGAFKALGGVFAVGRVLRDAVGASGFDQLAGRSHAQFTFATASSGNHGRAVAAGARIFGARSVIFLPSFTSAEKEAAIRARGAEIVRVDGDYEAAVAQCRETSQARGWTIISDTSWPGYETIPTYVMQGYTVLADEILKQAGATPTHVLLQAGVGGLAAAVLGLFWERLGDTRPTSIIVEPHSADCWFQSNRSGRPALASGDATTSMGGLACREISPLTWPILGLGADWFMTIEEEHVPPAMRVLARPDGGDPTVVAGPSGSSGMAALLRLCADRQARAALGLGAKSRVLLINSEGAFGEPDLFERATGLSLAQATATAERR
ncbi:MAG: diaminopropionate ammonia-lyase [Alphaproteobacteria bacterium]|nr:diaminopropionate ammonia-lyase [Alphaproteobacteria bacterium]MCW5741018.1 diaminopropionate ammonia-lyase [Alphaproteobacteria bacterium]